MAERSRRFSLWSSSAVLTLALLQTWLARDAIGGELEAAVAPRIGDQFQVNTYTTGNQVSPSVAVAPNGDFTVVWSSYGSDHPGPPGGSGIDTHGSSIQGQRYAFSGTALGTQFQVNGVTINNQGLPSVAMDSDGDFVVVFQSEVAYDVVVRGQRYAADGSALPAQFETSVSPAGNYIQFSTRPSVAMQGDGGFLVVWDSSGTVTGNDDDLSSIQARPYLADGTVVGDPFQVNTFTTYGQYASSVATDPAGNFTVVWFSFGSGGDDSSSYSIQGQRFAANATPVGGEFQVNTYTTSGQSYPSVATDADGNFVVVWSSLGSNEDDTSDSSIQARRFAADGSGLGAEFQVNTYTTGAQLFPAVAVRGDGDFMVVWTSDGADVDTSSESIQGQLYSSDGTRRGSQFQVNSYTTGSQQSPSVGVNAAGVFVVVWSSDGSYGTDYVSSTSIQAQRYVLDIFSDGFESGDTTAWLSVPGGV